MVKVKKTKKSRRFRGHQTASRGMKRRARGSGNQGGVGMAGSGKRGDQKKTLVIKLTGGNNYFGKSKALRRGHVAPKLETINISDIESKIDFFVKKGIAKKTGDSYELDLKDFKILGNTTQALKTKLKINAAAASTSAIEKVKSAGGELLVQ